MPLGVSSDVSWKFFGGLLGRLGGLLAVPGASWSILGASESLLGPLGGLLGASWGLLGDLLGPPGRLLGSISLRRRGRTQEEGEWTTNDISHRRGWVGGAEGRMMGGEVEAEERESEDGGCDGDVFFCNVTAEAAEELNARANSAASWVSDGADSKKGRPALRRESAPGGART